MSDNLAMVLTIVVIFVGSALMFHGWPTFITINRFDKKD